MRRMRMRFHFLIIALFFCNTLIFSQGYSIQLKAPDFAGQQVILAEYFTSRMVPKDTVQLNLMGEGLFQGATPFEGGLYIIFFNANYYFDFMIDRDQEFSIMADSSDLTGKTVFEGSRDNALFYEYKQFLATMREKQESISNGFTTASDAADSSKVSEQLEKLSEEMQASVESMIEAHNGSFFATFLEAMKDNRAPEDILKGTQREQDSIRYVYYKEHYFDHFDLSDIRLLHTPLYEPKVKNYISKVVPQHPDSLIVAVDELIEKSRSHEAIFRYMLITLFNNFAESKLMGMDKVYFHIAEKYYIPEATWSSPEFIEKLSENLEKSKPTFIGNIAPDFELKGLPKEHFAMAEMDTAIKQDPHIGFNFMLSQIPAKYTLLYFWESDCGHCQKSIPKLYEVFKKYQEQDVQTLAVHVINSVEGKVKWVDFVNEHQLLDWINCWSPYNNDFRTQYNLLSFPQLFLLDEEKKIIAKSLTPEQADDILNRFLNK